MWKSGINLKTKFTTVHPNKMSFKNSGIRSLFLMLVFFLFNTCEYENRKVYEREVDENVSPPEISVIELNIDHDTIFCYAQREIRFRFASNDQDIMAVRFTVDNEQQYIADSDHGIYNLDSWNFTNGIHSLTMEVYTGSGSGSIAEKLGMEGFLFSKSWVLVIDENYSSNIKSAVKDGLLNLSWNRYRGYDFSDYVVYRETGWGGRTEIARVKANHFIDSSYVGEGTRYSVEVFYGNSHKLPWGFLNLEKDLPNLHLFVSETNEYAVNWDKAIYYGAVDTFSLLLRTNYDAYYSKVKTTQNPEDTFHVLTTASFGNKIDLKLRLKPKKGIFYTQDNFLLFESYLVNLILGHHFGSVNNTIFDLAQVSGDEFVYISGCDSLVRYSVSDRRILERYGYQPSGCSMCNFTRIKFSASGQYITSYVDCTSDVLLANSLDFSTRKIRDLKSLTGSMYVPPIPVSDNGIMIANNSNGGFYLYNFMTDSTLAFYNKDGATAQGLSISKNGNYIFLLHDSLRLVRYENSLFTNVWSHSRFSEPKFYEFDGVNSDRMVLWNGTTFFSKRCSDFSTLNEFPLADELILDIDYYNNRILSYSAGYLNIRSLVNGALYKTVRYSLYPGYWYNACYLVNNAIISMQGVIYFFE